MTKCRPNEMNIASSSHGFAQGGMCNSDPSSDRALRAFNISMVTKTDSDRVEAFFFPTPFK